MKVSVKHLKKECKKILSVCVSPERIKEAYNVFFDDILKSARVPGFRPGKVPRDVLATHYRKEAKEEVLRGLISDTLKQALINENINPLTNPVIDKVEFTDEALSYDAHVEIYPDIKLGAYKGLELEGKEPAVTTEEVDETLERIRESRATFSPVEDRPAAIGDYVVADFSCWVDGKSLEAKKSDWFELKEKDDALPGFSKQLAGAKPGEEREVKTKFPDNFRRKDCAGKEAIFKVSVKEIKQKKLPEIDDAWAKELGEYKSVLELRGAIREDILEQKKQEEETRIERELLDSIIKASPFDLPQGVVDRRLDGLVEETIRTLELRGFPKDEALAKQDDFRKKLIPEAERQVRVAFILAKIAQAEGVKVEEADIEKRYNNLAAYYKRPINEIKDHYKKEGLEDSLELQILNEKVIRFIRDNAVIKTK
ncbi:MAG: trigger factor [Candidatus Omnitrophica bacterium]|nr:trigger factor [Candidatus Omnitrophota bacterium]